MVWSQKKQAFFWDFNAHCTKTAILWVPIRSAVPVLYASRSHRQRPLPSGKPVQLIGLDGPGDFFVLAGRKRLLIRGQRSRRELAQHRCHAQPLALIRYQGAALFQRGFGMRFKLGSESCPPALARRDTAAQGRGLRAKVPR